MPNSSAAVVAIALELPMKVLKRQGPSQRSTGTSKGVDSLRSSDRGHRPRVAREDQAALPAGAPPAVEVAGRDHPVAQAHRDVRAVGPQVWSSSGSATTVATLPREALTDPVAGERGLALLARDRSKLRRAWGSDAAASVDAALAGTHLAGARARSRRPRPARRARGRRVERPSSRATCDQPSANSGSDREQARIGEPLQVVPQANIARPDPGLGDACRYGEQPPDAECHLRHTAASRRTPYFTDRTVLELVAPRHGGTGQHRLGVFHSRSW